MVFLEIPNVPLGTVFAETVTIAYVFKTNFKAYHDKLQHLAMTLKMSS